MSGSAARRTAVIAVQHVAGAVLGALAGPVVLRPHAKGK